MQALMFAARLHRKLAGKTQENHASRNRKNATHTRLALIALLAALPLLRKTCARAL
jgi:hypothetical protein